MRLNKLRIITIMAQFKEICLYLATSREQLRRGKIQHAVDVPHVAVLLRLLMVDVPQAGKEGHRRR